MNDLSRKLTAWLGSRAFWYLIVGFFIFQALWIAFSAVYPQAFDEDFHLGVIRIYAEQWSPFLTAHPAGADQFGAIARDPSYLYHYLMSFPYRLITVFTSSEAVQVTLLRLLNIAFFTYGLVLFRRVMLQARASRPFTHAALAIFILIPIVPQLAAHINYDNVIMVLLPLLCLSVFQLTDSFRQRRVSMPALLGFIAVCLYISVVKYAALPFVIAALIFLVVMYVRLFRGHFEAAIPAAISSFKAMRRPLAICLLALCTIGGVLFAQRYAVNVAQYKTPVPDCGQVLSVEQCNAYGPWGRDHYFAQIKPAEFSANPLYYMKQWLYGMWYRLFFAVSGASNIFANYPPLLVPSHVAVWLLIASVVAVAIWWRQVFRGHAYLFLFLLLTLVYCAILWLDQYGMYRQTAQPVAINGRYLLPILPLLAVILGRGLSVALRAAKLQQVKALAAVAVIVLFLHGGGLFTFILRSDSTWYWPVSGVRTVNEKAKKILAPVTWEGSKFY